LQPECKSWVKVFFVVYTEIMKNAKAEHQSPIDVDDIETKGFDSPETQRDHALTRPMIDVRGNLALPSRQEVHRLSVRQIVKKISDNKEEIKKAFKSKKEFQQAIAELWRKRGLVLKDLEPLIDAWDEEVKEAEVFDIHIESPLRLAHEIRPILDKIKSRSEVIHLDKSKYRGSNDEKQELILRLDEVIKQIKPDKFSPKQLDRLKDAVEILRLEGSYEPLENFVNNLVNPIEAKARQARNN